MIPDSTFPWKWVDGSEFGEDSFSYWNEGEPNFGKDTTAYCAYIGNGNGHWDDNVCQDQPHRFICKTNKDQGEGIRNIVF